MRKLIEYLAIAAITALFVGSFGYVINSVSLIPDVYVSHTSGDCVKVVNYDERFEYTCENYPSKYNHIWIQ
jgi:hypothetical protein